MKKFALENTLEDWQNYITDIGEAKYRATQIAEWIWKKHATSVEEMTNLSKTLREKLDEDFDFSYPEVLLTQKSKDGTRKFLLKLQDGETIEMVLMKYGDRLTLCLSTQVGCPLGCTFCATGASGFARNLTAGEIAAQFLLAEKIASRDLSNVVYMGMGEPFLNTEAVLKSIRLLNNEKLRGFGIRHFTISTSGIIKGIEALRDAALPVRLAVSLHAADNELRSFLMPVNETNPLPELRKALVDYQEKTNDRISFEYALFGEVNDTVERARELVHFLRGIHSFVNLIPYNSTGGRYKVPTPEAVLRFKSILETAGFETEIRSSMGQDIDAACGQLRRKMADGEAEKITESYTKTDTVLHANILHDEANIARYERKAKLLEQKLIGKVAKKTTTGGFIDKFRRKKDTKMGNKSKMSDSKVKRNFRGAREK